MNARASQEDDGRAAADRDRGAGNPSHGATALPLRASRELSPDVPAAAPKQERLVGLGRSVRAKSPMGGESAHGSSARGPPPRGRSSRTLALDSPPGGQPMLS